jgi:GAF domain-containing protein
LVAAQQAARVAGEAAADWWNTTPDSTPRLITNRILDQLFRVALLAMTEALNADALYLLLANEKGDELLAHVSVGLVDDPGEVLSVARVEDLASRVFAARDPVVLSSPSPDEAASPGRGDCEPASVVVVPMLAEGRLMGVLCAGSRRPGHFTNLDVDILDLMAEHLVSPLARVQSLEGERSDRKRAERVADRLARLQDITARIVTTTTVEEIPAALAASLSADGTRWCGVWLARGDQLVIIGADRVAPSFDPDSLVWPLNGTSALARVVRERRPIYLSSEQVRQYWKQSGITGIRGLPPGDRIGVVPLILRDQCFGAIVLIDLGEDEFDTEERNFLAAVGHEIAQGIDRANLYAQQASLAKLSSFLAEAAQVVAEAEDFEDTLDRLAGLALAALGDLCLIDVIDDDGQITRMVARHRDPDWQHLADRLKTTFPAEPVEANPVLDVMRSGRSRWAAQIDGDFLWRTSPGEPDLDLIQALELRSYLAVPLLTATEVLGSLTLVSASRSFEPDDVAFAERLAQQVAAVLGNARRHDAMSRTSHVLQQRLLPQRLPPVPGLQVDTRYLPATRGLDVGGDFYDVIMLDSRRVGFLIGDVAGHDSDAAAVMGQLRSAARALAGQAYSPAELISAIQASWDLIGLDRMATGIFGRVDVTTGELALASAGHYPPLLVTAGDGGHYLPVVPSTPLGAPATEAANWIGRLRPDQTLLLYTDGALDERHGGSANNMHRLATVAARGDLHPGAVCQRILETLPVDRSDDVALLALRLVD